MMRFLRSEEHTSELQSPCNLVCRLLLEKKKYTQAGGRLGVVHRGGRTRTGRTAWRGPVGGSRVLGARFLVLAVLVFFFFFFFNVTAPTEIYPLSLHAALPICSRRRCRSQLQGRFRPHPPPARRLPAIHPRRCRWALSSTPKPAASWTRYRRTPRRDTARCRSARPTQCTPPRPPAAVGAAGSPAARGGRPARRTCRRPPPPRWPGWPPARRTFRSPW